MDNLSLRTREAYDAEVANEWTRAYELHEGAMQLWKEFAGTAGMFPGAIQKHLKQIAEKRAELHKSRLDAIRPFAKQGKPVPETVRMHPSRSLVRNGVWDCMSPAQMPLSEELTAGLLNLTMVCRLEDRNGGGACN